MSTSLDALNSATPEDFVAALGGIFEHSPWVAEAVVAKRPFSSVPALYGALCGAMVEADADAQMRLICAHPQLAGKAAIRGELTEASTNEQRGAGLDQCSAEEFAAITQLNADYDTRFGFPFIIAVKGHSRHSIITQMRKRISRPRDVEIIEALRQIQRIAYFRLAALLAPE